MTARAFFYDLIRNPQPTRTDVLEKLESLTRGYKPERLEALIADLAEMLSQWQCDETYNQAKRDYDVKEREHRAEYDEMCTDFEIKLNRAHYALATGSTDPIQWPKEPPPYEPLPFFPPMPGEIADNIHSTAMYDYAVEVLRQKLYIEHSKSTVITPPMYDKNEGKGLELQRYNAIYEHMQLLWDGDYIPIGQYGDEGACNPTVANREKAIKWCAMLYKELEPYEEDIIKDYREEEASLCGERRLFGAYGIINHYQTYVKYLIEAEALTSTPHVADSLQPTATDKVETLTTLPDEFETTEAKKYINKAMELGLIPDALVKGVYGWNGNKKELVLFCELLSEACGWKNRKWKVGEQAFGVMRLAQSRKKAEDDGKFGKNEKAIKNMFKK